MAQHFPVERGVAMPVGGKAHRVHRNRCVVVVAAAGPPNFSRYNT